MVAARRAIDLVGTIKYREMVHAIDWNRVLVQARGLHYSTAHHMDDGAEICGNCIQAVLLRREE